MILDDALDLAEQANEHLFHQHLHLSLPSLHLEHQLLLGLEHQLLVLQLFLKQVPVPLQPQQPLRRADGVTKVRLQLNPMRLTLMSAA